MANSSLVLSICTLSSSGLRELSFQNTNLISSFALNNPPAPRARCIGQVARGFVVCVAYSWELKEAALLFITLGQQGETRTVPGSLGPVVTCITLRPSPGPPESENMDSVQAW